LKRIAIFFDGTSNRSDAEFQTNVVLLSRCVSATDADGSDQLVQYYQGVGTGRGSTALSKMTDRALGGALALGLTDVVEEAYRALAFAYEPGDELYIFGFSRGAFTARVFSGLLRSCGIPPRRNLQMIPAALARHLSHAPDTHPDHPHSIAFRAKFAPETATSASDLKARRTTAMALSVRYLGLWDTVKSFAVAQNRYGGRVRTPRQFHDLELSSMVESARHAIAIDERRSLYPVVPFTNFDALNARRSANGPPPYQQLWFPGNHGSVGGGGNRIALSSITLRWVAIGAIRAGLRLNKAEIGALGWHMDPLGPISNRMESLSFAESLLSVLAGDRRGPDRLSDLSMATVERCLADPGYRPRTLRQLRDALSGLGPEGAARISAEMQARDGGPTFLKGSPYWMPEAEDQTS
jgi:uncharacterized protein (DUF2235 family)